MEKCDSTSNSDASIMLLLLSPVLSDTFSETFPRFPCVFLKKIIFQGSVFVIGFDTIANTIAVIIGGGIGLFLKKGIKKSLQDSLLQAMGIAVLFIGIGGTLS